MDDRERHATGMKMRRAVLGDAWVDKANVPLSEFNGEFQDLITRYAWGEVWSRPGLPRKTRSCMVLSILIGLGHWEEYKLHLRGGVNNGLTQDDVKEIILQAAIYAGVPAANHGAKLAAEFFASLDQGA